MAENAFPIRAAAYTYPVTFYDSLGRVVVSPTLAAGDIKILIDGGASANIATLPTETPASSGRVPFVFSTGEMTGDEIYVICKDQTDPKAWMDFTFVLFPVARQLKDLAYPATTGRSLAVDTAGAVPTTYQIKKNTALAKFGFVMFDSTNHAPATGLTVTGTVSKDGAAFGALTNAVVEIASGAYYVDLAAADLNANVVILKFTATGADAQFIVLVTQI